MNEKTHIRGHVTITDRETGNVVVDKDNLVLLRTRIWLFENLFKTKVPTQYTTSATGYIGDATNKDLSRQLCLIQIGSGGADNNNTPFVPHVPVFNDTTLKQPVPFVTVDPDKVNSAASKADPSIRAELIDEENHLYYDTKIQPTGITEYYTKRPNGATDKNPYGNSKGFDINMSTGEVTFTLNFSIEADEARGQYINELGLMLGSYNAKKNTYDNVELATRLTFDSESFSSLTKALDIKYTLYI